MGRIISFPAFIFIAILFIGEGITFSVFKTPSNPNFIWVSMIIFLCALIAYLSVKIADQWDRVIVLRLGKFLSIKGPGLFFIIPIIDTIPYIIDTRVITASFKAEKTLTKDTVPVDVDAVLFWKVIDPKKAALDVADYQSAINWA